MMCDRLLLYSLIHLSPVFWVPWLVKLQPIDLDCHQPGYQYSTSGLLYYQLGQWDQAIEHSIKALDALNMAKDAVGMGQTLTQLSEIFRQRQQFAIARQCAEMAVYQLRRAGTQDRTIRSQYALALHQLGGIHYHQKRYSVAMKMLERCLTLRQEQKDNLGEAQTLLAMGQVYVARQQYLYGLACYEAALEICHQRQPLLEGPWLEAEVRGLIAQVCELTGHWDLALSHYLKAFSLGREVGAKTH
jgi:tetratricopeptide (TPR) repeat protein